MTSRRPGRGPAAPAGPTSGRGVRIGGSRHRGRQIAVPAGIRPSGGRLKGALFDIWQERLTAGPSGPSFLDLFAGSGAVGIEAVSRGAASADLVERDRQVLGVLRRTLAALDTRAVTVHLLELPAGLEALSKAGLQYDLIFADPPYAFSAFSELLAALAPLLAPDGQAAVEHSRRTALPDRAATLIRLETRPYGDSAISLYAARDL